MQLLELFDPIVMMSYLHNVKISHVKMSLFVVCLWNNIYIRLGIWAKYVGKFAQIHIWSRSGNNAK